MSSVAASIYNYHSLCADDTGTSYDIYLPKARARKAEAHRPEQAYTTSSRWLTFPLFLLVGAAHLAVGVVLAVSHSVLLGAVQVDGCHQSAYKQDRWRPRKRRFSCAADGVSVPVVAGLLPGDSGGSGAWSTGGCTVQWQE